MTDQERLRVIQAGIRDFLLDLQDPDAHPEDRESWRYEMNLLREQRREILEG